MKYLQVDDKWSIRYDELNNCKPTDWLRYDTLHSRFIENNAVSSMFYALLDIKEKNDNVDAGNQAIHDQKGQDLDTLITAVEYELQISAKA